MDVLDFGVQGTCGVVAALDMLSETRTDLAAPEPLGGGTVATDEENARCLDLATHGPDQIIHLQYTNRVRVDQAPVASLAIVAPDGRKILLGQSQAFAPRLGVGLTQVVTLDDGVANIAVR